MNDLFNGAPEDGEPVMDRHQKCPVCDGTGLVNRPPWVAGDQHQWSSTSVGPWPCKSCAGSGLIDALSKLEEIGRG